MEPILFNRNQLCLLYLSLGMTLAGLAAQMHATPLMVHLAAWSLAAAVWCTR